MPSLLAMSLITLVWLGEIDTEIEIPRSGKIDNRLAPIDSMMTSFLEKYNVPGAALAISKKGKLVYSAGFGWAEKRDPGTSFQGKPIQTDTLFRIASISKPITAAAILKLVEKQQLKLSDKVLDHLKYATYPGTTFDPRWKEITILHLLQHRGGFDREKSFDPMFRSIRFAEKAGVTPPASTEIIIRTMLGRPLDFEPGQKYAYSNFGYCLLGRVIEKCSDRDYETFVRQEVLAPAGIKGMVIGKSKLNQRLAGETQYFDLENRTAKSVFPPHDLVPRPYGSWYQESLDAHGGWLGTAEDLVRFADYLDKPRPQGLLPKSLLDLISEKPKGEPAEKDNKENEKKTWYGLGWQFREAGEGKLNSWHTGLLPGSSALLVRRHDGFHWAVLFNTQGTDSRNPLATKMDPLIHKAVNAVKEWPEK